MKCNNLARAARVEGLESRQLLSAGDGTIAGVIFRDNVAQNQVRDAGEVVLPSLRVWLDLNGNDAIDPGEPVATSDARGQFQFSGLASGDYIIGGLKSSRWQPAPKENVSVTADQTTAFDFPEYRKFEIFGTVFDDQNADRIRQLSEAPVSGEEIQINLNGSSKHPVLVTSDAQGAYDVFLPPGATYSVSIVNSGGRRGTNMPTGSASEGNSAIANLGSTTQNLITGTLFNDDLVSGKNNGIGFAGWEVFIDTNGNGKEDSDEPFTETDENGQYTFDDLSPGKYTVMAKIGDSEFASTTPIARSINLTHGESATLDFGFAQIIPLSGTVYDDLNGDGELSSADKPLAHITLFCDLNNNGKLDPGEPSAVSSSKGRYTIEGIGGRPVITAVTPAGLRQEPFDERNVLLTPTAAIKVEPFHDPNRNGKQDAGEHAENYLVDLLQADVSERGGSGWHDPTQPFYFDGDGFAGFAPGTYRIKFGIISPPIHPTHSEFVLTLKAGQVTDIMLGVVGL